METDNDKLRKVKPEAYPFPDIPISDRAKQFCVERVLFGYSAMEAYFRVFGERDKDKAFKEAGKKECKAYTKQLKEFKAEVLGEAVLSSDAILRMLSSAARGDIEMTQGQMKAADMLLRVHGVYNKDTNPAQQSVTVNIQGMDED